MTTRVYPPGPFPPHGSEPEGVVDLGIRLRDLIYTREMVAGGARRVLSSTVRQAAQDPGRLVSALPAIDMLVDTWPLGAMIDDARETWAAGPDGRALAVLQRAAEITAAALGWPRTVDRRWPMPDEAWIKKNVPDPEAVVVGRGDRDGSPAVAVALGAPFDGYEPVVLPAVIEAQGDEILARVDELLDRIEAQEAVAVRFQSPVPWDDASQDALGRIRAAAPGQMGLDRYGDAGLLVEEAPRWKDVLSRAPAGTLGDAPRRTCDALVLPTMDERGEFTTVGVLVWDEPYAPIQVMTGAVQVLGLLDGLRSLAEVAGEVDASEVVVTRVVEQLIGLGAASA